MIAVQHITSLDLPALAPYRTMRWQMQHRQEGIFVAEGEKVVRRLLESHFGVVSVLMPEKYLAELEPQLQSRPEKVQVYLADKPLLETLTGFSMYQGLLAVGRIPAQPSLREIVDQASLPRLLVAVDGLTSAENLGALVRNCAAFGVHGLIAGETCTSPYLRRAVRSSMGAIFRLPILELASPQTVVAGGMQADAGRSDGRTSHNTQSSEPAASLVRALEFFRSLGIRLIAAHPHAQGKTLPEAALTSDCCILFGSEGYGIARPLLDLCHEAVAIPMSCGIDSLNVATAAAVFLYETYRKRTGG